MSATSVREDAHKDPEQLVREIEETRADVDYTLNRLEQKLSPGQLLDQTLGMFRGHGGEFVRNLGSSVKQNPVPMLLTGIGLVWMMASRNSRPAAPDEWYAEDRDLDTLGMSAYDSDMAVEVTEIDVVTGGTGAGLGMAAEGADRGPGMGDKLRQTGEKLRHTGERLKGKASSARQRLSSTAGSVSDTVGTAAERARYQAQHARETFTRMAEEQPLVLGALGIALGAALGALLPPTEKEDRLLGRARDQALERAKAAGAQQYEKLRETAKQAAAGAAEAITQNGNGDRSGRSSAQPGSAQSPGMRPTMPPGNA